MATSRHRKLDLLVARIQLDYGPRALRRADPAEQTPPVPRLATTFAELDAALGGGVPQGRLTEITGPATSGKLTLAAKVMASAHRADADAPVAWVDLSRTCDPDYLHRCGIDLSRLLIVRPATLADALAALIHLVESNTLAVLAWDGGPGAAPASDPAFSVALARLPALLARTATAALFLTEPAGQSPALAHAAAVRIALRREQWLTRAGDVRGYVAQAEITKNRLGRAGARATVRITFNGTVRGDGL